MVVSQKHTPDIISIQKKTFERIFGSYQTPNGLIRLEGGKNKNRSTILVQLVRVNGFYKYRIVLDNRAIIEFLDTWNIN